MTAQVVRAFEASDWLGAMIMCPHCSKVLQVIDVEGPYVGHDPSENNRVDRFWILTLEDKERTRMWEGRKGVVVNPRVTS